jgi:hypothetical protein
MVWSSSYLQVGGHSDDTRCCRGEVPRIFVMISNFRDASFFVEPYTICATVHFAQTPSLDGTILALRIAKAMATRRRTRPAPRIPMPRRGGQLNASTWLE